MSLDRVAIVEKTSSMHTPLIASNKSRSYFITKRAMDILGAICGLLITLPIFLLICLLYMGGDSKGPVFFKQIRVGKNGQLFYIYKFRSMVVDADKKLKAEKALYEKYLSNNYKLEPVDDPRITNIGRFLRKTSLDELPQLINVLKGDMSLVGPRPVVKEELSEYKGKKEQFLSIKPGVTGYWAISGRSNVNYPERVDLELYYVCNQTLKLDLIILYKTFIGVFTRQGAY
ncbi:undecaprenyl-phosphate galactose phosphotransferase [Mycobacteroides abscessus subsp. abscessus]|nr:undecaprenyl-phosphate galactose phosphotransferase [Mycobacteroides abscessus subsp. abscessus]